MRRPAFLFVCTLIIAVISAGNIFAQHRARPVKTGKKPPAFPPYIKYKNRPPKINPYLVDSLMHPIPMARVLFHDNIDKEQLKADMVDGVKDTAIIVRGDSLKTEQWSQVILDNVDSMQILIENMPANGRDEFTENQQKIRYLRAVREMLQLYNRDPSPDMEFYRGLVDNMHAMLVAVNEKKLMEFAVENTNIFSIMNGKNLFEPSSDVRAYLYSELGKADPKMMIMRLEEFATDTFASEIIKRAAVFLPDVVFKYALSSNLKLRNAVYNTKDPLVQAIVAIAVDSKAPLKAFPFLSDVYYGRKTIDQIDSIADQNGPYFQNLVRLKVQNDSIAQSTYVDELSYRSIKYVRQMNELHEARDEVRFKCIDSLPSTSLFFIMVYGQDEIYTSTFLGVFKRLVERMQPLRGNQLLDSLHADHFRTFIRMCAGYNTLSAFLGTMEDSSRAKLMTNFIGGLEKGREDDLEDAVDVADAFGSIRDSALSAFLLKKVKENYENSYYTHRSKKGMVIYSLLVRLFDGNKASNSDTNAAVTSSRLHLPPINKVRYKDLTDDSGIVYQQVFFFGDKDGQDSYESFMSEFRRDSKWKIVTGEYWNVISNTVGEPTVIYANLPLKEPDDEEALSRLSKFLFVNNIHPTVMVHRGHSYHLKATLARLNPFVKIVVLGSCGGYHNLATVLDRTPDAHIISSKQTGTMYVNEPIIKSLNTRLTEGADVDWIGMWRELDVYFANKPEALEKFSDYVPPYKNLGAIFIKAYRKMMAAE